MVVSQIVDYSSVDQVQVLNIWIILKNVFLSSGVPSAPGQVVSTRETDSSLLIQWAPPKEPNNLIGYYIDQCVKGSKDWTSANHKPHKNCKYVFNPKKKH